MSAAPETNPRPAVNDPELRDAISYTQSIIDTVREPLLVLDGTLRVTTASRAFYQAFRVSPEQTIGQFVYDLGNGEWNIPALRTLLEEVLPSTRPSLTSKSFTNFRP